MIKEDKIYRIQNKRYYINEYVYTIKKYSDTFMVLVLDFKTKRFYIEDNYPLELFEKSRIKDISKLEFFKEKQTELEENIKDNFPQIYKNITSFEIQKSLF